MLPRVGSVAPWHLKGILNSLYLLPRISFRNNQKVFVQVALHQTGRKLSTSPVSQALKSRDSQSEATKIFRDVREGVRSIFPTIYSELYDMGKVRSKGSFGPIFLEFFGTLFPKYTDREKPEVISLIQSRHSLLKMHRHRRNIQDIKGPARNIFYSWYARSVYSNSNTENQLESGDMKHPHEWYPQARMQKRVVHLHVGPTNSGKTYQALKRLEAAKTGIYCGPLRLLAHEVYSSMNAAGVSCSLLTGDERRFPSDIEPPNKLSCTVEMAPMVEVDVVVVDEIQMIGNSERGWAWTGILLGSPAKEIHLCGETRAVPLVRQIVNMLGDELVIHNYNRLSPLRVMSESLHEDYNHLRNGDCIVVFDVLGIHQVRREVEQRTGKKVAIIYGSLPPETRAQQARLFNDPDSGYDILIASDAIGMGLNLSIRRVVFYTLLKYDGETRRLLTESEIKQIAGRAGRYRPPVISAGTGTQPDGSSPNLSDSKSSTSCDNEDKNMYATTYEPSTTTGWVTTFSPDEFPDLVRGMEAPPEPIKTAGLQPPTALLKNFAESFHPKAPHNYILERLQRVAKLGPHYHICSFRGHISIADKIQEVPLSIHDRIVMTVAPAGRSPAVLDVILEYAKVISKNRSITILDLPGIELELLDEEPSGNLIQLRQMESLHQMVVNFLWLSFRFPSTFRGRALAMEAKYRIEQHINAGLALFSSPNLISKIRHGRTRLDQDRAVQAAFDNIQDDVDDILDDDFVSNTASQPKLKV